MLNRLSKLKDLLKTEYPLIQGGMAWIADADLAASVSNAGGLGVIAAGNAPPSWVKEQIDKIRTLTDRPFGVNIMLLSPYVKEVAELAANEKVPVVITGAGNPRDYIEMWKKAGITVAAVVASSGLAVMMEKAGADFVIAEGCEAGGHIGEMTTMVLVPNVVRSVSLPVVAAGGIWDANSVAAAFCLGASGVQVGTRFILSASCNAHENYKKKIIGAKDTDVRVTGRSTGHPVRLLRNDLCRRMLQLEYTDNGAEQIEKLGEGSLRRAVLEGDLKNGSFMSGQCVCLLDSVQTTEEIVRDLFDHRLFEKNAAMLLELSRIQGKGSEES
jgi:enoyl-[acyl-carrier protein] reductase II